MCKKRRMMKKVSIGGLIAIVCAFVIRLVFAGFGMVDMAIYIHLELAMMLVVGVKLMMSTIWKIDSQLIGCGFFGIGLGGEIYNFVQFCRSYFNATILSMRLCEILCFALLFFFCGFMNARQIKIGKLKKFARKDWQMT